MIKFFYKENLFCILLFLLICMSGSIVQVMYFKYCFLLTMVCLCFLNLDFTKHKKNDFLNYFVFLFLIPVLMVLFNFFFSLSNAFSLYLVLLAKMFIAYFSFFTVRIHNYDIERIIFKTLKFISIHSLIGFCLSLIIAGNFIVTNDGYRFYLLAPFPFIKMAPTTFMGLLVWRNQGLFWEPGIMQIYANIYLFLALFKYNSKKDYLIAIFTVLTTFSTMGLGIAGLLIGFYFLKSKSSYQKFFLFFFMIIFIIFTLISFFSKVNESSDNENTSYSLRVRDIRDSIYVTGKYPLMGIGIDDDIYIQEKKHDYPASLIGALNSRGNSNGFLSILYQFGIIMFIFYVYALSKQTVIKTNKKLFFVLFVLSMFNEPISLTPFFLLFPLSTIERIRVC